MIKPIALAPFVLSALAMFSSGCTSTPTLEDTAVEDFIRISELESVDKIRTESRDSWQVLNTRYIIYETRRGSYLVQFRRECYDIDGNIVVADRRWESNVIRARFDTIRGCSIAAIYGLNEEQAIELEELGDAPGKTL